MTQDAQCDKNGEAYDQAALDEASREVHMMLLLEGSSWGTKACEEMGRVFMTAYRKAARPSQLRTDEFMGKVLAGAEVDLERGVEAPGYATVSSSGEPPNDGTAHIYHPLRHFDRTCLACWQETESAPSATRQMGSVPELRVLANALAAMKPEWGIGEESTKAWKQFVNDFQSGKVTITPVSAPAEGGKPLDAAMDNVLAWRIGEACRMAAEEPKCGDYIDRGLILLRILNERGFEVRQCGPNGGNLK